MNKNLPLICSTIFVTTATKDILTLVYWSSLVPTYESQLCTSLSNSMQCSQGLNLKQGRDGIFMPWNLSNATLRFSPLFENQQLNFHLYTTECTLCQFLLVILGLQVSFSLDLQVDNRLLRENSDAKQDYRVSSSKKLNPLRNLSFGKHTQFLWIY